MAVSIQHVKTLGDGTTVVNLHIGKEAYLNEQHIQIAFFRDEPVLCETVTPLSDTVKLPIISTQAFI